MILQELFYIVQIRLSIQVRNIVFARLRLEIYEHLMKMSQSFYANKHTGGLLSRITSDVDEIQNLLLDRLIRFIDNIIVAILIMIIISYINLYMVIVAFVFIPLLYLIYIYFSKRIQSLSKIVQEKRESLMINLQEDFSFIKAIQSYSIIEDRIKNTFGLMLDAENSKGQLSYQYTKAASSTIAITIIGLIIVWGYGGKEVIEGNMSLGQVVAISFYLKYIQNLFFGTYYTIIEFQAAIPAARRIFEILDSSTDIADSADAISLSKFDGTISFNHVNFSYEKNKPILKDLDFSIHKNDIVGITGESGVGKTTLVNLILRFYDTNNCSIKINGIDIKKIKLADLRKNIAVIPQENYIFNISIKDNILMGRKNISDDQVLKVSRLAGVHNFIDQLNNGYDSIAGERGILLSSGQRKRVLIARALLENPYILVFDEATSNLDRKNELLILDSIKELSSGRIILFISHRIQNLDFCNKFLLIKNCSVYEYDKYKDFLADY